MSFKVKYYMPVQFFNDFSNLKYTTSGFNISAPSYKGMQSKKIYKIPLKFSPLPAIEVAVRPGSLGSSRRGWCPHHCWSWIQCSPWWIPSACSARPQRCSYICRVCHYPAEVLHSHLKKHKNGMLWHSRSSANFQSVACKTQLDKGGMWN